MEPEQKMPILAKSGSGVKPWSSEALMFLSWRPGALTPLGRLMNNFSANITRLEAKE